MADTLPKTMENVKGGLPLDLRPDAHNHFTIKLQAWLRQKYKGEAYGSSTPTCTQMPRTSCKSA